MVERTTLPPPPPPSAKKEADPVRWSQVAPVLAVVAIVSTAVMTLLWLSARDEADQARLDADRAAAAVAEAEQSEEEALQQLADAQEAGAGDGESVDEAELRALEEEAARLADENDALNEDLAELREAADATDSADEVESGDEEPEPEATTTTSTTTTSTTTTTTEPEPDEPESPPTDIGIDLANPQAIGQFLGNLYRDSVLGSGQETCIGESVSAELGDQLEPILGADDPGADEQLVTALENAASSCQIDRTAIFG